MKKQPRVAAIHDLSGFGRCSLSIVLPVLSAAGIEACPIPTAVFSSHTGGLPGVWHQDLTEAMEGFLKQWKQLGLTFDAIYVGFLGSEKQISVVKEFLQTFSGPKTFILVDPAMADHGALYQTYTKKMAEETAELCSAADLIVPNRTESAFLLQEPYEEKPCVRAEIESQLRRLSDLGPRKVVLTGVWFAPALLGAAGFDRDTGKFSYALAPKIQGNYHGTGDLLAASLLAGILNRISFEGALQAAVDFTSLSIRTTWEAGTDPRYGVLFEPLLPQFQKAIGCF
ncbi:pyridoxamine kinase [Caproicibacterium sp. BJN0003]|uniref:pyridoxamine kinase n=1 Tax=Caproicibacterium sp. BJN0003 TaxID=2994078 RepID=UPI00224D7C0F|nr:pyridoxamine kinase [Caproicibacterium sp. BJN0003]UZT81521.1 pyridoxamine kinase [Caproicibacterium sp. BJN0003]